jgi:protein-L-isoaspartate(D-aspartate) O-methyltransferase
MTELNIEQARHNMIVQQIRPWEVIDERVLDLLAEVRREDFVPPAYRNLAFCDMQIPLGQGEAMMEPKIEARLIQELTIRPNDKVLEIGTGSGYVTALLARLGGHVTSVEIRPEFMQDAAEKLARNGINNVDLHQGDGARGWQKAARYDAIVVTGSLPVMQEAFKQQLAVGGRLVVIVGQSPVMEARRLTRVSEVSFDADSLFDTDLPPLRNAEGPSRFVF